MSSISDIIAGSAFRSDLQNTQRVLQAEWVALYNEAVNSAWDIASAARPDFQVASKDYTLASGPSASFQVPANFHGEIDLVNSPDTPQEYSLGPFMWQNRRSPGGWYWPALFGFGAAAAGTTMRLMGWDVYVEPAQMAGGTYRFWYCPKPHVCVQTVRLATAAALPACVAAGAGTGKTLTASANGALSVNGIAVAVGNLILVKNQVSSGDNGVYTVVSAGSVSSTWQLIRTPGYDTTGTILGGMSQNDIVAVGQSDAVYPTGSLEGTFWTLTTFTAIESPQTWTAGAAVEPVLTRFEDVLMLKMAIAALKRDKRSEVAADFEKTLKGPDGKSGREGEMKLYFAITRFPGPQRMIDLADGMFRAGLYPGAW